MRIFYLSIVLIIVLESCGQNNSSSSSYDQLRKIKPFLEVSNEIVKIQLLQLESDLVLNEIVDSSQVRRVVLNLSNHKDLPRAFKATHNLMFYNSNDSSIFKMQYNTKGLLKLINGGGYQILGDSSLVRIILLND